MTEDEEAGWFRRGELMNEATFDGEGNPLGSRVLSFKIAGGEVKVPDPVGPGYDRVNKPAHYTTGGVEVIDAIEAWSLDFLLANVVKYVARAGKKSADTELEDLMKARWYLNRAIAKRGGK